MSGLTHNVSAQANELLDHIYEYGTNSEGVISRINSLCDAAVEQLRAELTASREREARMRALIADDGHAMTFQSLGQYRTTLLRALAEGSQG